MATPTSRPAKGSSSSSRRGLGGQRAGDRDALRLPARQLARAAAGEAAHAEPVQPGPRGGARPPRGRHPGCAARRRRCRARTGGGTAPGPGRRSPIRRSRTSTGGSVHEAPPTSTRPPGSTIPARARSRVVLPAPLGPITATTSRRLRGEGRGDPTRDVDLGAQRRGWGAHGRTSQRLRSAARMTTERTSRIMLSVRATAGSRLQCAVDQARHRLGGAGVVAREGDGGAELAERAGPGQDRARHDPGQGQRQGDPAEGGPAGRRRASRRRRRTRSPDARSAPSTART